MVASVVAVFWFVLLMQGPFPAINRGQLAGLHGEPSLAQQVLTQALARMPTNSHWRWQAGQWLLRQGDSHSAAVTLHPLLVEPDVPDVAMATLLKALIQSQELDNALRLYQDRLVRLPPTFPPYLAANLAMHWLAKDSMVAPEKRSVLLQAALDFRDVHPVRTGTIEFAPLAASVEKPEFWSSTLGKRLNKLLAWAADPAQLNFGCRTAAIAAGAPQSMMDLLGLPAAGTEVGKNLVADGDFEETPAGIGSLPVHWNFIILSGGNHYAFDYHNSAQGAFTSGVDRGCAATGHQAARVDGLWLADRKGMNAPYAGIQHAPIDLVPHTPTMVSLLYRTEAKEDPHLWLRTDLGLVLPPTYGRWQQAVVFLPATFVTDRPIQPFLQIFSQGTVWFDNLSVRQLQMSPPEIQLPTQVHLVVAE